MAIKEYELKDIVTIHNNLRTPISKNKRQHMKKLYPYYGANGVIDYINFYKINFKCLLIPEDGSVIDKKGKLFIKYIQDKISVSNHAHVVSEKKEKILLKFLYYSLLKQDVTKFITGSVQQKLNLKNLLKIKIQVPNLQTQQNIINIIEPKEELFLKYHKVVDILDLNKFKESWSNLINIIEPFEKMKYSIQSKKEKLFKISFFEINRSKPIGTMIKNKIIFEKGKNVNSKDLDNNPTNLPFINVSAINNKINKFISNPSIKKNIRYGDVILSLDGTIGIVNNFLEGYNGYGYKVFSENNLDNSIIYYSLLNPINQKIIYENSTGSVIKHASQAKNKILLFNFKNEDLIEIIFKYEIKLKKIEMFLDTIIKKLINLFLI